MKTLLTYHRPTRLSKSIVGLVAGVLLEGTQVFGQGSLTPPSPPGPTMKTLDQLEPRTPISSLPFVITNSGSYYVTTNLIGVSGQSGIIVSNDNVTLDLRGFALVSAGGFGSGIYVPNLQYNISVRNGIMQGWGDYGIRANNAFNCQYEDLKAKGNGRGFVLGTHCVIRGCMARDNFYEGFLLENDTTVLGCSAQSNGADGFNAGANSQILNSYAGYNSGSGFGVPDACTVKDCVSAQNGNAGIQADSGCRLVGNTCNYNAIGIDATGGANRVDSNLAVSNSVAGIQVAGTNCNVIVRNQAMGNAAGYVDYLGLGGNVYGSLIACGSTTELTSGSGWENFTSFYKIP